MSKSTASSSELDPNLFDATADTALSAIERALNAHEQLIQEWLKRANAAAINEVAERGSGGARKSARRALNVLRARGIPIPVRKRVSTLTAPAEEVHEAWLLAPDALGNVLLVITAHAKSSRYRVAFVVMHDALGIHRVEAAELSHSQLKDAMLKFAPGVEYKPVRVPIEWARKRIAGARLRHAERGAPEPLGLTSAQALLEPVPEVEPSHPLDDEGLELADEDARELTSGSARLHGLPEFRNWLPAREAVDELLLHVGESLNPGEEPEQARLQAAIEREINAATDRFFSPERREQLVRVLKDSALSVLQREGEVVALELVAAMKLIERAGLITDPPHEIPFLRAFFEKAISVLAAQGQGRLRIPIRPKADDVQAGAGASSSGEFPGETNAPSVASEAGASGTSDAPQP